MDKDKALKNITIAIILKVILLIVSLVLRRYLLSTIGNEANGLFSLYTSILGFLAIAELGIGIAITFSMYKPIVENDNNKISGLFHLYKKVYRIIFIIIITIGLGITPFIPKLAKDNSGLFNIYLTYIIYLISTSTTYLYADKTSLINANQDVYITTIIRSFGLIVEAIIQIIFLVSLADKNPKLSFNIFMLIMLCSNIMQMIITNIVYKLKYSKRINGNKYLSDETKKDVSKRTKALFFHKVGGLLVNTTDSLVISAFIGVTVLGAFTNYVVLVTGLTGILSLIFSSTTSIIGHSFVKNSKEVFFKQFTYIYIINYVIGFTFLLGFYAIVDSSILLLFSNDKNLILSREIVTIITINYFIQFMRQSVLTFRDASGNFYSDRYKPIFEGVINLILSILLVKVLGVAGVLIATIITNVFITHTVEPYVIYKYSFEQSTKKYYYYNYVGILLFIMAIFVYNLIPISSNTILVVDIIIKGLVSVTISLLFLTIIYLISPKFRKTLNSLISIFLKYIKEVKK